MNKIMPHYNQYFKIFLTTIVAFCISLCLISKITFADDNDINIPPGLEAEIGAEYKQASDKDAIFNRDQLAEYESIKSDTSHPIGKFNADHTKASLAINDYHIQLELNAKEFSKSTDLTDTQKAQIKMHRKALFRDLIDKQEKFAQNYLAESDRVFREFIALKGIRDASTTEKKARFAQQVDNDIGIDLQSKFKPALKTVVTDLAKRHNDTIVRYHEGDQIFKTTFTAYESVVGLSK